MRRFVRWHHLVLATALVAVAVGAGRAASAEAAGEVEPSTTTPIKHFVTLMQENHTFDNYFGTYPGADGIPAGVCMPNDPADPAAGCVQPHALGKGPITDLSHDIKTFDLQYDGGKLDGFVNAFSKNEGRHTDQAMGHYEGAELPFYWNVADENVLFDRFFTSSKGGSTSNHMYWVAGVPGTDDNDRAPAAGFDVPTIFDRLQEKGISWKFYVQNYDPAITFRNKGNGDRAAQVIWVPPLAFPRFLDTPDLFSHIVPMEQYYQDLADNTLPAVSYLVPSGSSEHPPGSIQAGQSFVRTLISSLMRSRSWPSSAFMWTYDDWGGWYDHVAPPQVDARGYGFRAPALLVSPYAKRGHVEHATLDFTSMLKFIEDNWQLAPLGDRDRSSASLTGAFDFVAPPRQPALVSATRQPPEAPSTKRGLIVFLYSGALLLAIAIILAGAMSTRRGRRSPAIEAPL